MRTRFIWTPWPRYLPDTFGTRPRYLGDSGPGTCLTHVARGSTSRPVATFFAVGRSRPQIRRRPVDARGVGAGGAALSGGVGGAQRRGHGDRCGPPVRGGPPDGARVVAPVRGARAGRVGGSSRRGRCRVRIRWPPVVEARIVEMRRAHPGWGPRTILYLARAGGRGRRCRGGRRWSGAWSATGWSPRRPASGKRADYKRWERSRAMELWQMDIVGGVRLADG